MRTPPCHRKPEIKRPAAYRIMETPADGKFIAQVEVATKYYYGFFKSEIRKEWVTVGGYDNKFNTAHQAEEYVNNLYKEPKCVASGVIE